jgi:hypothetical protein
VRAIKTYVHTQSHTQHNTQHAHAHTHTHAYTHTQVTQLNTQMNMKLLSPEMLLTTNIGTHMVKMLSLEMLLITIAATFSNNRHKCYLEMLLRTSAAIWLACPPLRGPLGAMGPMPAIPGNPSSNKHGHIHGENTIPRNAAESNCRNLHLTIFANAISNCY